MKFCPAYTKVASHVWSRGAVFPDVHKGRFLGNAQPCWGLPQASRGELPSKPPSGLPGCPGSLPGRPGGVPSRPGSLQGRPGGLPSRPGGPPSRAELKACQARVCQAVLEASWGLPGRLRSVLGLAKPPWKFARPPWRLDLGRANFRPPNAQDAQEFQDAQKFQETPKSSEAFYRNLSLI